MSEGPMRIWNAVSTTDPAHTKHVGQRGGFTAIDAMYQVRTATEQFGPVGFGWGWDASITFQDGACIAKVELWWQDDTNERHHVGPVYGCKKFLDKGRLDEDAPKKAVTDGLTKALSYLGFNADVFLGKFDDNKYVAAMNVKYGNEGAGHDGTPEVTMDHSGEQSPVF